MEVAWFMHEHPGHGNTLVGVWRRELASTSGAGSTTRAPCRSTRCSLRRGSSTELGSIPALPMRIRLPPTCWQISALEPKAKEPPGMAHDRDWKPGEVFFQQSRFELRF